jgi:YVTN family beta-propeller protein
VALSSLAGFRQMVVDSADGYIFISEGSAKGLAVFKTDGTHVTTLDSGDDVEGITLSGGTLYAADVTQDAVVVIDAATATQTATWSLGASTAPYSVAVQSGKLWVSYGGAIGDFDLSAGTFQAVGTASAHTWSSTPDLAADPNDTGVLVASDEGISPATVATYNTSTDPAASIAGPTVMVSTQDWCTNGQQAAVIPGGTQFVLACSAPYEGLVLATNSLPAPASTLTAEAYPGAAAVASDGSVAIGTTNGINQKVYVYGPDLTQRNVLSVPGLAAKGIAWGAGSSTLYAVSGSSGSYTLNVFDSPEVAKTTLTLSSPATSMVGSPVTLTGELTYASGAPAAGDTVSISRLNPDGTTTTLTSAQTDSNGAFTISDTPPAQGAYTYTASYAGTATTSASQATAKVTASLNTATVVLSAGSTVPLPGTDLTFNGTLSFGIGTPAVGTPLAITRANPDGSTTTVTTAQTASGGAFSFTDAPTALGTYTYTASYAGDSSTASARGTTKITVALATATIRVTAPKSVVPLKSYTVTGSLGFSAGGPSALGKPLTVTRKNPNGTTTKITGVATTDANGDFSFAQPAESVLGAYTYTVSYAGDATTAPATSTATVTIAKGAAPLTLSTGPSTALYDSTIHVTAHLGSTYSNRTVSVYAQLIGTGTRKLLKTAAVNSAGNLVISYPSATRNVIFTTTFSGDAQYAARSVSERVGVAARVAMSNSGWYTSAAFDGATYRVFHHTGTLHATITVTPNKHGECVRMNTQELVNGKWAGALSPCFPLNSASQQTLYLVLAGLPFGHYRAQAIFVPSSSDVTNISYYTGWFYFQVAS